MAPTSEGIGLTSALKQVYYIHKSVVADLTSKNQILAEECKKLKSQLKQSTNSGTGQCQTCHRLKRLNRSLEKALLMRDMDVEALSGKGSPSKKETPGDKRHTRKRLSDDMLGSIKAANDGDPREVESQKKMKSLPPVDCLDLTCDDEEHNQPELHPLETYLEPEGTESRNITVLAPETEMVTPAGQAAKMHQKKRTDKISEPAGQNDVSLQLGEDEEESQKILAVPETMNVDDLGDLENDKFLSGNCGDESISSDEENLEPSQSVSHRMTAHCQSRNEQGLDSNISEREGTNTQKETKASTLSSIGSKESKSGSGKPTLSVTRDKLKENQPKHTQPNTGLKTSSIEEFSLVAESGPAGRKTQEVKGGQQSVFHATADSAVSKGKIKTAARTDLFKVPQTTAQKLIPNSKLNTTKIQDASSHILSYSTTCGDKLKDISKFSDSPGPVSNQSKVSKAVASEKFEAKMEVGRSPAQSVKSPASMDETIAPSLLNRQQLLNESVLYESQTHKDTTTGSDAGQNSPERGYPQQMPTLQLSTEADFSPSPRHDRAKPGNSNKSPGGKKSLKLNKSVTEKRPHQPSPKLTVREIAKGRALHCESFPSQKPTTGGSIKDLLGETSNEANDEDTDLSDDSDIAAFSDQENETIAPSPQASLPATSVPCSSRSYKFVSKKSVSPGDLISSKPTHQQKTMDNDASQPILLDEDVVDVDVDSDNEGDEQTSTLRAVGFRTSTLRDEDVCETRVQPSLESIAVGEEDEEILPDLHEDPLVDRPELEDSFDRVPREAQNEIPHVEVVRKKSERDKLEGFSCKQCHEYYKNSGLSEEELKKKMKICSRHKERYKPPDTPEHFWTLGFPDTAEMMDRQKPSQHNKVTPVNVEKRPRRKRQLQMKF